MVLLFLIILVTVKDNTEREEEITYKEVKQEEPNPEKNPTYNYVTPEERVAGATDSKLIKWCSQGCRIYYPTSDYEYKKCFNSCLVG